MSSAFLAPCALGASLIAPPLSPFTARPLARRTRARQLRRTRAPPRAATEDPLTARVRGELAADGIDMDELLNAGKVVSLTRELDQLHQDAAALPSSDPRRAQIATRVDALQSTLACVRRQTMRPLLKQVFVAQAVLFAAAAGLLAADRVPFVPDLPIVARALGFWTVWLFCIPSLRARKGLPKWEKSALNVAFLAIPVLNLAIPFVSRDCTLIWAVDVFVLAAAYFFYFGKRFTDSDATQESGKVKGVLKFLDWGSWR